ncbi:GPI transamidase component PIG-S-like protein [Dinothrombium tinctorium]|uniref:GPI transamidase component PIG-S-like protein n=1 Tax=Dinothrombium tinctorium TaxID=1965070 RepID=A0A443RR24_9ACAR|nr:GPI transamidase component PIG-S-like protein [Dinothrombium tinctorium]
MIPKKWTLFANHQNKAGLLSSLFYIVVILLLGIPIWYKTTTPLRHSLPDISSLLVHSQMISNQIEITVVSIGDQQRDQLRNELVDNWKGNFQGNVAFRYAWKVRQLVKEEKQIFVASQSLYQIDRMLDELESHRIKGHLFIYLIPENTITELVSKSVLYGSSRFAYISVKNDELKSEKSNEKPLSEIIVETVETMLEPKRSSKSELLRSEASKAVDTLTFLLNNEIDILINLVMEDVEEAIEFQDSKRFKELKNITRIAFLKQSGIFELIDAKITTQMVYYALPPSFIDSHLANSEKNNRLFKTSSVPQLLNAIESRIVEHDNKQSYLLTVYIPSQSSNSPLFFFEESTGTKSNAIVTPYRGGILVWNDADDFNVGFKSFMRNLIGLNPYENDDYLVKNNFFTKWELDAVIRKVTLLQLAKTLSSLESIEKLLGKVSNIVILEEIATKMHYAVKLSHESMDHLAIANLEGAFNLSCKAYKASETAFFDPSLLALLYFPDDQKYAVYFPLFLPVSLPLIASIHHIIRSMNK